MKKKKEIKKATGLFISEGCNGHYFFGVSSYAIHYSDGTSERRCGLEGSGYSRGQAKVNFWKMWKQYCKDMFGKPVYLDKEIRGNGSFELSM